MHHDFYPINSVHLLIYCITYLVGTSPDNETNMQRLGSATLPHEGRISLDALIPFFPWAPFCRDQGFTMPYPEIMMISDQAYNLYTQISGLLMTEAWEIGNELRYRIEAVEGNESQYILELELSLENFSEIWALMEVSRERVISYLYIAAVGYVRHSGLLGLRFACERISEHTCRLSLLPES